MKRALILGAGFAGCTAAQRLHAQGGWEVLMLESGESLGAAGRTHRRGEHSYTEGPMLFSGIHSGAFEYLDAIQPMERLAVGSVGSLLEHESAFETPYEQLAGVCKQMELDWYEAAGRALHAHEFKPLPEPRLRAPSGPLQLAYPRSHRGYDDFFEYSTQACTLVLEARLDRIDLESKQAWLDGQRLGFDVIISSDPIDDLFGQCYGPLKFLGMQHTALVLPMERALPEGIHCCYHQGDASLARTTEYKKFNGVIADSTLLTVERPVAGGRKHPLPFVEEKALARRYAAELPDDVFSIGRLGRYRSGMGPSGEIADGLEVGRLLGLRSKAA